HSSPGVLVLTISARTREPRLMSVSAIRFLSVVPADTLANPLPRHAEVVRDLLQRLAYAPPRGHLHVSSLLFSPLRQQRAEVIPRPQACKLVGVRAAVYSAEVPVSNFQ